MKKIFSFILMVLCAVSVVGAGNYVYYVAPTEVKVTKNADNQYTVVITQKGRNIYMDNAPGSVYSTTATLVLFPTGNKLEGTYSSADDKANYISSKSGNQSKIVYESYTRYLNTSKTSTFTIAKIDQTHYCIVSGAIHVNNSSGDTYAYHYSYNQDELTKASAEIGKKVFEFETTFSTGYKYNYDMSNITDLNVSGSQVTLGCHGERVEQKGSFDYTIQLNFSSGDINGEYSTVGVDESRRILPTSFVKWVETTRYLTNDYVSNLVIVKDGEGDITIAQGTIQGLGSGDKDFSPRRYTFSEIVKIDENKANNEVLLQNCGALSNSLDKIQLIRSMQQDVYNTFCAPFDMSQSEIEHAFGNGADVRELVGSSYDEATKIFNLEFSSSSLSSMVKGKPYLVKPTLVNDEDSIYFVYKNPYAFATEAQAIATTAVSFVGVLSPYTLSEADADRCLFLMAGNQLAWGEAGSTMKGMRGYFLLNQPAPAGAAARICFGAHTPTDIVTTHVAEASAPKKQLRNGELIIVRNGQVFNVQGKQIK